jgi:O-antigen/teichoic acid export membrane protein
VHRTSDDQHFNHSKAQAGATVGQSARGAESVGVPRQPVLSAAGGGSRVGRNTFLNLIGLGVPVLVGVVTIPFMVRRLGVERYGLFSLVWVILGYLTTFDLGLGRATTKYVAEALASGEEHKVPRLVWMAVTVQALFGVLGMFILAGITPFLVERILTIPVQLRGEAKDAFYLLALAIPVVLISSSFSGVLEAAQRFDVLNAVKIPTNVLTFVLPAIGAWLGFPLVGIVGLMLLSRILACATLILVDIRMFPGLKKMSASFALLPRLFSFGGWVAVSSTVAPMFVYADRFLIASLFSVAAVTYYTAPYEAVTRLWIIPVSLAMTLFPTFSALDASGDAHKVRMLFARSIKYTLLAVGPIVFIVVLFAEEILQIWLGGDFPARSAPVLKILAMGVLINSVAQIAFALVQGVGRPDLTAKFHLIELPFYFASAWVLLGRWGIAGAAMAWTLRVALDALLLFVAAFKLCSLSPLSATVRNGLTLTSLALVLLAGAAYVLKNFAGALPLSVRSGLFITVVGVSALLIWRNVLDATDRGALVRMIKL